MLRYPYTNYNKLHIYNIKKKTNLQIDDPDLIGIWHEQDTILIFFIKRKMILLQKIILNLFFTLVFIIQNGKLENL